MNLRIMVNAPFRYVACAASIAAFAAAGCAGDGRGDAADEGVGEAQFATVQPTCIDIFRGGLGDITDNPVRETQPTTNFGNKPTAVTGPLYSNRIALMGFDISAIPTGAAIISADLKLYETLNLGASTIHAYRALAPWDEATTTWNSFGSALAPAAFTTFSNGGAGYAGPITVSIQSVVQDWVLGVSPNHGIGLVAYDSDSVFGTSENGTASYRPMLSVCYALLCQNVTCNAIDECHGAGSCDPLTGQCSNPVLAGATCGTADACNSAGTCDANGTCQPGAPVNCDDNIACTVDSCDAQLGCVHDASACGNLICGTVTQQSNNVISPSDGASVTVGCDAQNNIIKGTTTAPDGSYCVGLSGPELNCSTFYLTASKAGFTSVTKTDPGDFAMVTNGQVNVNFQLDATGFGTCLAANFEDNFEGNQGWTVSASEDGVQWQRKSNSPVVVNNTIGICVTPAADEASYVCQSPAETACVDVPNAISRAYSGQHAYWFGNASNGSYTGNFLGVSGTCNANNGGQGLELGGTLTSPTFTLPAGTSIVQFRSWFEIEAVDPQQYAFDSMIVRVIDQAQNVHVIGTINPELDANGTPDQPFSSGGFNAAPVWNLYTFDISQFGGQDVQIQFYFRTNDGLYNGFRGWLVDDVYVSGQACP